MINVSVVIICKNEVAVIEPTLQAAALLTPTVVILDTGSTDGTIALLKKYKVTLIQTTWQGFGLTKNIGIDNAPTDWILSLDADEVISPNLITAIKALDLTNPIVAYDIPFLNYFGNKPIKYGEWSGDSHIRLFNKKNVVWNAAAVHEELVFKTKPTIKKLAGRIHHRTVNNQSEMQQKLDKYAHLNAQHYYENGKKGASYKKYASSLFNFIKNYFFKLGFLDGKAGLIIAIENARYTYKKYLYLQQLQNPT